jgi:hypothetical protein
MAYSFGLDLHSAAASARSRMLQRSFLLALLSLCLWLPAMASAQQGKCFKDSNGRVVCCDANGNCK